MCMFFYYIMNTPTKTIVRTPMTPPGAPMKMTAPRTPMTTSTPMTVPGAPKKPSMTDSVSNAASGAYHSVKGFGVNLFGNKKPVSGGKKRRSMKKSRKSSKSKKGMASKTRKGRKDYITHKGDKYYNRKGKRQTKNRKGRKGKPYSKRR